MEQTIKKIAVFDFDGTLISTELPETGKVKWKEVKGQDWPHKGWWGRAESLDINIFDNNVIEPVIKDYQIQKQQEDTLVIMLTGRRSIFDKEVKLILDKHGLEFHREYYNTGGETITCKLKTLNMLLKEFPHVEQVTLWEDRAEHVPRFEEWGKTINQEVIVNFVEPVIDRF